MRPPISGAWQVLAKYPITRASLNTGVSIVISLIWPAVCQGSFVISTSPGCSVSAGYAFKKCRTPVAMALMCPGVPVSDWAIIEPCVSKTPQARSCDSRTTVLKAIRINVTCCSFTTESKRFHSTSRVIGSSVLVIAKYPRLGVLVQQAGCAVHQYGNDNPAQ